MHLIVAATYNTARLYVQHTRPDPRTTKIVTDAERMRAFDPRTTKITIVDDGCRLRPEMIERIAQLECFGADVAWVSLDRIMGVDRDAV